MVKFKEYSKRCICILSICVCFLVAVFCPFDLFLADEKNETILLDYGLVYDGINIVHGPSTNFLGFSSGEDKDITFYSSDSSFTMYSDYSLKTEFTPPDALCKFTFEMVAETIGEFSDGLIWRYNATPYIVYNGIRYDMTNEFGYWTCTFYAEASSNNNVFGVPVQFDLFFENFAETSATYDTMFVIEDIFMCCSLVENNEDALLAELNSLIKELLPLVEGQEDIYNELVKIYESSASIDEKLTVIRSQLGNIKSSLTTLHNDLANIDKSLSAIQETLDDMNKELDNQTNWLSMIWGSIQQILGLTGENGVEGAPEQDDSDMVDLGQKEDDLLSGSSPGDASADLKVELDAEASAFIWDTINEFVTVNPTVFGVFISVLSLGILALILGR